MFKKKKKVVYKSPKKQLQKEEAKELPLKIYTLIISISTIILSIFAFILFPLINVELPPIYLNNIIWVIIFSAILITTTISLILVRNQGANKKLFVYFSICGLLTLFNLIFSHILNLFIISLFISAFLLYFSFICLHELRKTNLSAYALFFPFVLFSIYNLIIYYLIVMLN